jgi:hypothetical protein
MEHGPAIGGVGVDVFEVDIVDEVGLGGVEGSGESAHEGAEQAGEHEAHQADGQEGVDGGGEDLFEICSVSGLQTVTDAIVIEQGEDGQPDDHGIADGQEDDVDKTGHFTGFLRAWC